MIENIYDDLQVGDKGFFEKTITEADVTIFAGLTGDYSWLHCNEMKAQKGLFKQRIVHGMLLMGLVSCVIGTRMPGAGTIYESQNINFLRPCFFQDTIRAETEVIEKLPKGRIKLKTTCVNQKGEVILNGEAIVIPPRKHSADVN